MKPKKTRRVPKHSDKLAEGTPVEHSSLEPTRQATRKHRLSPRFKVSGEGKGATYSIDHLDQKAGARLIMKALGIADEDFFHGLLLQMIDAGIAWEGTDETRVNFLISAVKSIDPQDEIETMLAAQMAVIHAASMASAGRLARTGMSQQQDSASRALNNLARTFAAQMEALNRHRGKGQQKVTVEHVHVHSGGQAVVGVVEAPGGGVCEKMEGQSHAKQITHAPQPTLRGADAERPPVSIAGDAQRPLSNARRKGGRP